MLREQALHLPRAVIARALEKSEDKTLEALVDRAIRRILDGDAGIRIALMRAALPLLSDRDEVFAYPCVVRSDRFKRLVDFCQSKSLGLDVLFTGAMMVELEMVQDTGGAPDPCSLT